MKGQLENIVPAIETKGLEYCYEGEVPALKGVDIIIDRGDFVALIGQNGSGKTTLVKHFNGLLRPTRGKLIIGGIDSSELSIAQLSKIVGYVFQNPDHQIFCSSVAEELSFGPRNQGLVPEQVKERVEEAANLFNLIPYMSHPPATLGFGLRRKVSIASIYTMHPEIFILDEPTSGLDFMSTNELMRLIEQLNTNGHTIILVTHDMKVTAKYAKRTIVLREGHILLDGPTKNILTNFEVLLHTKISPPQVTKLTHSLKSAGKMFEYALTVSEFCSLYLQGTGNRDL